MKKLSTKVVLWVMALLLLPAAAHAQQTATTKGLDTPDGAAGIFQPAAQMSHAPALSTMRRINSNTEMYGIFQKRGESFFGKGKIANPMSLDIIMSSLTNPSIASISGCALVDGTIYTVYQNPISFDYTHMLEMRRFSAETGEEIGSMREVSPIYLSEQCTTDPITGEVWGRFAGNVAGDRWEIACVDFRSLDRRAVGLARRSYICMGMTNTRQLYAVGRDANLYRISTEDGSETLIGSTGLNPDDFIDESGSNYYMNGAIDPEDNTFYMTYATNNLECSLMSIDLTTGKATEVATFAEQPLLGLVIFFPNNSAEDDAPAQVSDFEASFPNGSLTGNVSFNLPTKTYAGAALTGQLSYVVKADGEVVETGTGNAGSKITSKSFTLSGEGLHGVEVVASNDKGKGAQLFHSFYAGIDAPTAPSGIVVSVNPNNGHVQLSWTAPGGKNNGYVGDLTYTVVRYPDNVVVASGLTTTSFSEDLDAARDIQPYTYGVTASNSKFTGDEGMSNKCVFGAPLDVPYQAYFGDIEYFTMVDVNNDGRSFATSYVSSSKIYLLGQYYGTSFADVGEMDDWLITPKINLEAGKRYKFAIPQFTNPNLTLSIHFGKTVDVEDMTGVVMAPTSIAKATDWQSLEQEFTVPETGAYHIGIHSVNAEKTTRGIYIRNTFTLDEVAGESVPAAPTNLQGTGGERGAKNVHLSFTAPTRNAKGQTLTETLKMNVRYRNRIVKTVEDVAPGANVEVDYANDYIPDGYNTFSVTAENADGNGQPAETSIYVGVDTPVMAGDVIVVDQISSQKISWTPVTTIGKENYYVDPEEVEYVIYDVTYSEEDGTPYYEELARVKGATTYVYQDPTNEDEQHETYKGVRAVNKKGVSNIIVSAPLIKGAPYGLPFEETLSGGTTNGKLWWVDESNTSTGWDIGQESYDTGSGCFTWTSGANNERAGLYTGKISLKAASNKPVVSFAYYAVPGQNSTIILAAQTPDGTDHQLTSVAMRNLEGSTGWRVVNADLNQFKNEEYVIIKFIATTSRRDDRIMIDAINVYDMLKYNLAISLSAPSTLKAGMEGKVTITVTNTGEEPISNYTVRLSADDEEVFSQTVNEALASQDHKEIAATYKPSVNQEEGLVILLAEVETDLDLDDNDNWIEAEVDIREATAAEPLNVRVVQKQLLMWDTPGVTTEEVTEVLDEIESYDNGGITTDNFLGSLGDWTVYDGDGREVYNFNVNYPGRTTMALAWMAWDTTTQADEARRAPVGTKYFVSFNPIMGRADDWLISPELSGESQTVSLQLNVLGAAEDTPAGTVEILYTTEAFDEDNQVDFFNSFTTASRQELNSFDWKEVTASLPAGVKHFAVRNISNSGIGVAVTLLSYEKSRPAPISFNVYADEALVANTSSLAYAVNDASKTWAVSAVYASGEESRAVEAYESDEELPAAIASVAADATANDFYRLSGQKAGNARLKKSVYVQKGRKVITK
ncbi:MAG: choice-of-anchor J domain-containing protein [Prevotella sp.]|nr:choice-of-anchor J domain-containing protein [Prevotella sp.]